MTVCPRAQEGACGAIVFSHWTTISCKGGRSNTKLRMKNLTDTHRMVAAFAPALRRLGDHISSIFVAAASGSSEVLVAILEILRIAVTRSAMCISASFSMTTSVGWLWRLIGKICLILLWCRPSQQKMAFSSSNR